MGRGKRSLFASLFGWKKKDQEEEEEAAAVAWKPQQRNYQAARVRPSDDDEYYGRHWYAERDINRRASEVIERVHRGMLASEQDG
ncbi:hypothetical protein ACP70R_046054 [Stipagrostis hirtigluma subsp. patula]